MRRTLFAVALLAPSALLFIPQDTEASRFDAPEGDFVYRPQCFQQYAEDDGAFFGGMGGLGTKGSGMGGGGVAMNAPMSAPAGVATRSGGAGKSKKSAAQPMPTPKPKPAPVAGGLIQMEEAEAEAPAIAGLDALGYVGDADVGGAYDEIAPAREPVERQRNQQARSDLDWGADIYLSNDDSMSLASAQRVLYAAMNGMRPPTEHIRPHELLNYFSFDTTAPTGGDTFALHSSAERNGDSLTMALAVQGATPTAQPLDLTVVLDRSCSMADEGRMDYTRRGMNQMVDQLNPGDRIDLVLFDDTVCTPIENYVHGRDDERILRKVIGQMQPEGGTDMNLGLKEGYKVATHKRDTHRRNRRMMVLTDAMLNTGDINHDTVSEIGRAYEKEGIRLTGIGVGRTFNDDVLNKLTEKGKGAYVFLGSEAVVDRVFGAQGFASLTQTIAHDVHFQLDLPESLAMQRFYGEEASTNKADVQPIHYYAGTSQLFLQDLTVDPSKLDSSDPVKLTVTWRDAHNGEPKKQVFHTTVGKMLTEDHHNVNKAQALMAWTDLLLSESMGGDVCGAVDTFRQESSAAGSDAELAFVQSLIADRCPNVAWNVPVKPQRAPVAYKVRVDSDIPIAEVSLACDNQAQSESLSGSDTVARFDATPGYCTVTLAGAVPMVADVEVPETGGDLRCMIRGGRMNCS